MNNSIFNDKKNGKMEVLVLIDTYKVIQLTCNTTHIEK